MPTATPDLAGYIDAQLRKRASLCSPVTFHFPKTLTYPEGTVLGPNGKPYDPQIEPDTEEGREPLTLQLSVAFKPARLTFIDDTVDSQVGEVKEAHALTWVTLGEWGAPNCIIRADSFDYAGDNYLIRKNQEESIAGAPWRVLIWGERQLYEGQVS